MLMPTFRQAAVHGGVLFRLRPEKATQELSINSHGSDLIPTSLFIAIDHAKRIGERRHGALNGSGIKDWGLAEVKIWLTENHMGHLEPRFRAHAIHGALLLKLTRDVLENFIGFTEIQSIAIMRGIKQLKKAHRKGTRARREAKLEVPLYKYAKENDPRAGNATPDNVPVVGVSTPVETGFLRTATCISTQSTQRTMSEAEATAAYQPHLPPAYMIDDGTVVRRCIIMSLQPLPLRLYG